MKKYFCILFCLVIVGCQEQSIKRPSHLIPEDKMVRILADLHTTEAQIESTISYPDTALMVYSKLEKQIWAKHDITEKQFRDTYDFYTSHLTEMDKLYEIVTDTLIAREAKYAVKSSTDAPAVSETELDSIRNKPTPLNRLRRNVNEKDIIDTENL